MRTAREIPEEAWMFLPLPIALAGPAHGFCLIYSKRWWSVHPEKGLRFYNPKYNRRRFSLWGSPQCNGNRVIAEGLLFPGDICTYLERVQVQIDISEYRE